MTAPRGRVRLVVDINPDTKEKLDKLARFSKDGTLTSYVTETLEQRIDQDWPALREVIERLEGQQQKGA